MSNPLTKELDVPAVAAPHLMPPPLPTAADVRRERAIYAERDRWWSGYAPAPQPPVPLLNPSTYGPSKEETTNE